MKDVCWYICVELTLDAEELNGESCLCKNCRQVGENK